MTRRDGLWLALGASLVALVGSIAADVRLKIDRHVADEGPPVALLRLEHDACARIVNVIGGALPIPELGNAADSLAWRYVSDNWRRCVYLEAAVDSARGDSAACARVRVGLNL